MTDLTEKWKNGELPDGFYYFRLPDSEIDIASEYKMIRYRLTKDADKIEILAPVPSYEELQELKSEIKHLKDLQANQDKEVEMLMDLLKECKKKIEKAQKNYCYDDAIICIFEPIITRINSAIGESEE